MNASRERIVITGASSGIGKVTALKLASPTREIVVAGRSADRTRPIVEAINAQHGPGSAQFLPLDLASFTSVRRATQTLRNQGVPITRLINNAGVGGVKGVTEDGFEEALGTNHLGHFLFTLPLMPLIAQADSARVINVASEAHYFARGLHLDRARQPARMPTAFPEYAASKLANVLFSAELAERTKHLGVDVFAVHPGTVATNVWREYPILRFIKWVMLTEEQGAQNTLFCASDAGVQGRSGLYWEKQKATRPSRLARDPELRKDLWERSEIWTDCRWSDLGL